MPGTVDENNESSGESSSASSGGFDNEDITLISAYEEIIRLQSEGQDEQAAQLQTRVSKWAREGGSLVIYESDDDKEENKKNKKLEIE